METRRNTPRTTRASTSIVDLPDSNPPTDEEEEEVRRNGVKHSRDEDDRVEGSGGEVSDDDLWDFTSACIEESMHPFQPEGSPPSPRVVRASKSPSSVAPLPVGVFAAGDYARRSDRQPKKRQMYGSPSATGERENGAGKRASSKDDGLADAARALVALRGEK